MNQGKGGYMAYIPEDAKLVVGYAPTDQKLATEAFQSAGTITLPYHRFIKADNGSRMFHCDPFRDGRATRECDNRDDAAYCRGHDMSRADFIRDFCGGVEPRRLA